MAPRLAPKQVDCYPQSKSTMLGVGVVLTPFARFSWIPAAACDLLLLAEAHPNRPTDADE